MKLLCFQAKSFSWKSFSKTLDDVPQLDVADEHTDCVVIFFHAEAQDEDLEVQAKVFKTALKHIKWLANKRKFRNIVLHSFAHLGGTNATPEYGQSFMTALQDRLESTDYSVKCTPYGYFCEWSIDVHGESMAKVWKQI